MPGKEPDKEVRAHQYLYYVLGRPVLSDFQYDLLCEKKGVFGGGGSDCESHYSPEEKEEAARLLSENQPRGAYPNEQA